MKYWINDVYYEDEVKDVTIFQACSNKNVDVPCFCYHERLSIAGNCRMCLVESSKSLKLVVSCAMPLENDVKIYTNNYRVYQARENVLEFLLNMHPLDCPICDQGGECDLQDITVVFGSDRGRFYENAKRAVFDKECGPFIKTIMTRCIHCTRCIRFLSEVSGVNELGMVGRGNLSEIATFVSKSLNDELSGNIIDLCPVGALTAKPYAFNARPWELNTIESVDILDGIGSSIRVDYFNNQIYRILPVSDISLNEDWITNKIRFVYDSQHIQRLKLPLIKINDKYIIISYQRAINLFFNKLSLFVNTNIVSIVGNFLDINECSHLLNFMYSLGGTLFTSNFFNIDNVDFRENFLYNNSLNIIENYYNIVFLNINLRVEAPILYIKIKRLKKICKFFSIGNIMNSYINFDVIYIGNALLDYINLQEGRNMFALKMYDVCYHFSLFNEKLNKKICLICGNSFYYMNNYIDYSYNYLSMTFSVKVFNVLTFLSYINFCELGIFPFLKNMSNSLFILNNVDDEIFLKFINKSTNDFIYIGSFFDKGAKLANLIFPMHTFFEKESIFFNIEGDKKKTKKILYTDDFLFYDFLKNFININWYFSKHVLKYFKFLKFELNFKIYDMVNKLKSLKLLKMKNFFSRVLDINYIYSSNIINYYNNDVFSRNSKNLHLASVEYLMKLNLF